MLKRCYKCTKEKTLNEFHKNKFNKDGKHFLCKECRKDLSPEARKRGNDKRKVHYQANLRKYQGWQHLKRFGITPEDFEDMLDRQDGLCGICKRHYTEFNKRLAVDHCHETNKVRGLLCSNCNVALGIFKDSLQMLSQAMDYLYIYETT